MDDDQIKWYLMKNEDRSVFGPVTFHQIKNWAASAQISPRDLISDDQKDWQRAPTIPELEMDWLVQSSPGQLYGPTTVGSVIEFIKVGELHANSLVINCCDNKEYKVKDVRSFKIDSDLTNAVGSDQPRRAGFRQALQERVRELEELVMEERRLRLAAEDQCRRLKAQVAAK